MENSIKMLTIGAVMIAGIVFGGIYAVIIETLIVFDYIAIKNS